MILQQAEHKISDEEAKERMAELDYLKVIPREQEVNKQVLLRGERLYEESLGDVRDYIQDLMVQFDAVLARQNKDEIDAFREQLIEVFDEIERWE